MLAGFSAQLNLENGYRFMAFGISRHHSDGQHPGKTRRWLEGELPLSRIKLDPAGEWRAIGLLGSQLNHCIGVIMGKHIRRNGDFCAVGCSNGLVSHASIHHQPFIPQALLIADYKDLKPAVFTSR